MFAEEASAFGRLIGFISLRSVVCLMKVTLPVAGHAARWSRRRLIGWVVLRIRQCRTFEELVRGVIPKPILPGFEASDDAVARILGVPRRVLAGGRVTATDVAALRAPSEVKPPSTALKALDATSTTRRHGRIYEVVLHGARLAIPQREPRPGRVTAKARNLSCSSPCCPSHPTPTSVIPASDGCW